MFNVKGDSKLKVMLIDRARLAIFLVVLVLYTTDRYIYNIIPPVAAEEHERTCHEGKQKASG